jgi:hypothetical protein
MRYFTLVESPEPEPSPPAVLGSAERPFELDEEEIERLVGTESEEGELDLPGPTELESPDEEAEDNAVFAQLDADDDGEEILPPPPAPVGSTPSTTATTTTTATASLATPAPEIVDPCPFVSNPDYDPNFYKGDRLAPLTDKQKHDEFELNQRGGITQSYLVRIDIASFSRAVNKLSWTSTAVAYLSIPRYRVSIGPGHCQNASMSYWPCKQRHRRHHSSSVARKSSTQGILGAM